MRNQRQKTSQEKATSSNLADPGWAATQIRALVRRTPRPVDVAGPEATAKACGVAVAKLQGYSWAPNPSSGSRANVGTIPGLPSPVGNSPSGGKARRRLMAPGWDGGSVVVGGRESRPHGEGIQRALSSDAKREGRR